MIANMNNGTVEFHEHDGTHTMTLPNEDRSGGPVHFKEPTIATILLGKKIFPYRNNDSFTQLICPLRFKIAFQTSRSLWRTRTERTNTQAKGNTLLPVNRPVQEATFTE